MISSEILSHDVILSWRHMNFEWRAVWINFSESVTESSSLMCVWVISSENVSHGCSFVMGTHWLRVKFRSVTSGSSERDRHFEGSGCETVCFPLVSTSAHSQSSFSVDSSELTSECHKNAQVRIWSRPEFWKLECARQQLSLVWSPQLKSWSFISHLKNSILMFLRTGHFVELGLVFCRAL